MYKYDSRKKLGNNGIGWYISAFTVDDSSKTPENALEIILDKLQKERYNFLLTDNKFILNNGNMPKEVKLDKNYRFEVTRKGVEYMNVNMIYKGITDDIVNKNELAHRFWVYFNVYLSENGKINKKVNDKAKSKGERDIFLGPKNF